jgi:hypothetical protein
MSDDMYDTNLLKAAAMLSRISETVETNYVERLKKANLAQKAIDEFIEAEVARAKRHPHGAALHVSWDQIGEAFGLSKSAAYSRYGKEKRSK